MLSPKSALFAILTSLLALMSLAQQAASADFPTKPITLVVPYGTGTGSDVMGRLVAQYLGGVLGQSVVVLNRPGATGGVGTMSVVRSEPDGYTLVFGTNATLITTPILYPSMKYNPKVDLAPVALVGRGAMMLVTRTASPSAASIEELAKLLREKPHSTYGSTGLGTNGDIISRLMLRAIGAEANLVSYRGSGDSLIGLLQGDTSFIIDTPTAVLPMVNSGALRAIAVTGTDRLKSLPTTPTFQELGVKGLDIYVWYGVLAPANTPPEIKKILSDALAKTVKNAEFISRFDGVATEPFFMASDEFKEFIGKEEESFGGFIRSTGIKVP